MPNETIKLLTHRVVEHTTYDDKVIHIENVSYDMAIVLAQLMSEQFDSYFIAEGMED